MHDALAPGHCFQFVTHHDASRTRTIEGIVDVVDIGE